MVISKNQLVVALIGGLLLVGVLYFSFLGVSKEGSRSRIFIHLQYPEDLSDPRALIGASHNVFVGKVVRLMGNKERGIGPETQFEVEVVENIKGDLQGEVIVNQQGGYRGDVLYVIEGDNFTEGSAEASLLQEGSIYLFSTRFNAEENWHTLISFPGANKVLASDGVSEDELREIAIHDSRIQELKDAYPNEKYLEADIKNKNTLNSYDSMQVDISDKQDDESVTENTEDGAEAVAESETSEVEMEISPEEVPSETSAEPVAQAE